MQAKDLMSKNPEIISPDITLKQAAEKMRNQDIGFLPIGENDRLIGAITDRDIVIRGLALGKDSDKTIVRDVMTDEIRYCFENDSLDKVAEMMGNLQIRRIAVLNEDKRIVGIISLGDVATKSQDTKLTGKVTTDVSEGA
jgi:CBS domain-containing protein